MFNKYFTKRYALCVILVLLPLITLGLSNIPARNVWTQDIDDQSRIDNTDARIILTAPTTCKVGELVVLDASKSNAVSFEWRVIPVTSNFEVIEEGERAFFCAGEPGTYLFIISAAKRDTVDCVVHSIKVTGVALPTPVNNFTLKVKSWLPQNPNPKILEKLAISFERVASAGHTNVETLVKTTALSNRGSLGVNLEEYKPFLINFSSYLKENYSNKSIDKHTELWFQMASSLRSLK